MDNLLTKRILIKLSGYLSSVADMTKPEMRCLKDMVTGILKSRAVFVNQIAASLREPLRLEDVAKRLSAQYLKEDFADKMLESHLGSRRSTQLMVGSIPISHGSALKKRHLPPLYPK